MLPLQSLNFLFLFRPPSVWAARLRCRSPPRPLPSRKLFESFSFSEIWKIIYVFLIKRGVLETIEVQNKKCFFFYGICFFLIVQLKIRYLFNPIFLFETSFIFHWKALINHLSLSFGLQSWQYQSPEGTDLSFGLRQYMWWPRSQPSHSSIFSGSVFRRQIRHLAFITDLKRENKIHEQEV
jgi:hypothetical protein